MKRRPPNQPTLDELVFRGAVMPDPVTDPSAYEDMIREDRASAKPPPELPADVPRADDALEPVTDVGRGLYFWQTHDYVPAIRKSVKIQLSSHVTPVTPKWCAACKVAFAEHCVCECGTPP